MRSENFPFPALLVEASHFQCILSPVLCIKMVALKMYFALQFIYEWRCLTGFFYGRCTQKKKLKKKRGNACNKKFK